MKICWVTCTYNRAHLLPRTIRSFESQTYPDRHMLILDDGGQYGNLCGDRWTLVSLKQRFPSLGAKRNASIALAIEHFPGIEAIMPVDDDDFVLPRHTEGTVAALQQADWSRPSVILAGMEVSGHWLFQARLTGSRADPRKNRLYHPAWGLKIKNVLAAGGYPDNESGPEDKTLMLKLEAAGTSEADPIALGFPPSYVYSWGTNNISGMLGHDRQGVKAWARLEQSLAHTDLAHWDWPFDPMRPFIAPGPPRPRPF